MIIYDILSSESRIGVGYPFVYFVAMILKVE